MIVPDSDPVLPPAFSVPVNVAVLPRPQAPVMVDPSVDRVSCPSFHAPPILKVSLTAHVLDV